MKKVSLTSPGVYLFKDQKGKVLYVGKAANLKQRINSYFSKDLLPRQRLLMEQAKSIKTIEVDSEVEALILEANLIKKYLPDFNVQLKDDKDYLYLKIVNEKFPRVLLARKKNLNDAKIFFGPFPSATSLRSTLKTLRKIFPFRTCRVNQGKACFYHHLGLCPGVCLGKISEKDYLTNIRKLKLFYSGNKSKLINALEKEMWAASKAEEFEKAETIRKKIESINYITRPMRRVDEYLEASSVKEIREEEITTLAKVLRLNNYLSRIECYDISNFQGSSAVGSMVVFSDGTADKGQYRRFKIKDWNTPNDPAMMGEVIRRRLKNDWPLPDLIIVDGGKTQLNSARAELAKQNVKIPIMGLAKRNEEIHTETGELIRLPKNSPAIYLITRIRDEAHRFAITYYRKLASKNVFD